MTIKKTLQLFVLLLNLTGMAQSQIVNVGDSNYVFHSYQANPVTYPHTGPASVIEHSCRTKINNKLWAEVFPLDSAETIYGIALTGQTYLQGRRYEPMEVVLTLYAYHHDNGGGYTLIDSVITDCTRPRKEFVFSGFDSVDNVWRYGYSHSYEALFSTPHYLDCDSIMVAGRVKTYCGDDYRKWDMHLHSCKYYGNSGNRRDFNVLDTLIQTGGAGPLYAIRNRECPQMSDLEAVQYDANHVQLTWPRIQEASNYRVEYGPSGHLFSDGVAVDSIFDTTYLLLLDPGYQYDIYVSAYCDQMDQYGMPSSMVSVAMPDTLLCPVVEGLSARPQGAEVHFVWDTVSDHSLYQLAYCPYHLSPDSAAKVPTSEYELYIDGVFDTNIYYAAYVRGKCRHQCNVHDTLFWGPWSDPVYFYTGRLMPDTSGTHGQESITNPTRMRMDFGLQPNPAQGRVEVVLPDRVEKATITLMDASGKQVMKQTVHRNDPELNLKRLPKGVYFVTLTAKEGTSTQKLVVE